MIRYLKTFSLLSALLASVPAHAYVDPGTGSMAIQLIVGGVLAAGFMIKTYYYGIKRRINRMLGRDTSVNPTEESSSSEKQSHLSED
jgi:hypothetical protein